MWRLFAKFFNKYPKQKKIAQKLLEYGLRIENKKIYCEEIEIPDAKIARAFCVDRRIIKSTIDTIMKNRELSNVFSNLCPTCHLKNVASKMHWSVIEIIPTDPSLPGIISNVAKIVAEEKISIRQAIVEDFELSEEPRLRIIIEEKFPPQLIQKIKDAQGVKAVLIY